MITDPESAIKACLGQTILGFHISDEIVTIVLANGIIEFDFDEGDVYVELKETN